MTAAFFAKVRVKIERANALVSSPVTFLDVNATEARDVAAGTVTLSGGESITVDAFPPGLADHRSIEQGLAGEGQQMFAVRAEVLVRSGGISFVPERGQRVTIAGKVEIIDRISQVNDEAGLPVVFFCALRS